MIRRTQQQAVDYIKTRAGSLWWGGYNQCVAFARHYVNYLGTSQFGGVNSAKDMVNVSWPAGYTRSSTPQVGDIAILGPKGSNKHGHVNIVTEVGVGYIKTSDQNLQNDKLITHGNRWSFPNARFISFIRPQFVAPVKPTTGAPKVDGSVVGRTLYLKPVPSWKVYQVGSRPPRTAIGTLAPAKYGGLQYRILGVDVAPQTVIIQTQTFGRVAIYVDKDAEIR
jgi:surface antigen